MALEITQGGFIAQANCSMLMAATGGATCELEITTIEGVKYLAQQYQPIQLAKGDTIRFCRSTQGVRCYLAIRGR